MPYSAWLVACLILHVACSATIAAAAGVTPHASAKAARCTVRITGSEYGIKEANVQCTGGTITAAVNPLLEPFAGKFTGVHLDAAACAIPAAGRANLQRLCMLTVCGHSHAIFEGAVITNVQGPSGDLWNRLGPKGPALLASLKLTASTLCLDVTNNPRVVKNTLTQPFLQAIELQSKGNNKEAQQQLKVHGAAVGAVLAAASAGGCAAEVTNAVGMATTDALARTLVTGYGTLAEDMQQQLFGKVDGEGRSQGIKDMFGDAAASRLADVMAARDVLCDNTWGASDSRKIGACIVQAIWQRAQLPYVLCVAGSSNVSLVGANISHNAGAGVLVAGRASLAVGKSNIGHNYQGIRAIQQARVTVTNASTIAANKAWFECGAGVAVQGKAQATISAGSKVTGNTGRSGGGLCAVAETSTTIMGSTEVANNTSFCCCDVAIQGGGLFAGGSAKVLVDKSSFTANRAYEGGAVFANDKSRITIKQSTLARNRAYSGGALATRSGASQMLAAANIHITGSVLADNVAITGGGVFIHDSGNVSITRSQLRDNYAESGGAVAVWDGSVTIDASNLTSNRADPLGGAVLAAEKAHVILSGGSHIAQNSARLGGGMYVASSGGGKPQGANVVLAGESVLLGNKAAFGPAVYIEEGGSASLSIIGASNRISTDPDMVVGPPLTPRKPVTPTRSTYNAEPLLAKATSLLLPDLLLPAPQPGTAVTGTPEWLRGSYQARVNTQAGRGGSPSKTRPAGVCPKTASTAAIKTIQPVATVC